MYLMENGIGQLCRGATLWYSCWWWCWWLRYWL